MTGGGHGVGRAIVERLATDDHVVAYGEAARAIAAEIAALPPADETLPLPAAA